MMQPLLDLGKAFLEGNFQICKPTSSAEASTLKFTLNLESTWWVTSCQLNSETLVPEKDKVLSLSQAYKNR